MNTSSRAAANLVFYPASHSGNTIQCGTHFSIQAVLSVCLLCRENFGLSTPSIGMKFAVNIVETTMVKIKTLAACANLWLSSRASLFYYLAGSHFDCNLQVHTICF